MIDAYEIGIALVLRDGVSAGLAAIQKDLAGVDRAIAATALGLADLQRVAMGAMAAAGERVSRTAPALPRAPAEDQPMAAPDTSDTKASPAPVTPAHPPEKPAVPGVQAITAAMGPVVPSTPVLSVPVTPTLPAQMVPTAGGRSEPMLPAREEGATAAPRTVETSPRAPEGPIAIAPPPTTEAKRLLPEAPPVSPVIQIQRDSQRGVPAIAAAPSETKPVQLHRQDDGRSAMAGTPRPIRDMARPGWPNWSGGDSRPRPVQVGVAPASGTMPVMGAPLQAQGIPASPPAPAPSYAPPPGGQQENRISGDVFLDGARVGRWLSARLEREAGRPTSGPTGFDPRRSPSWPGATVLP